MRKTGDLRGGARITAEAAWQLTLIAAVQVLAMATWFSVSAVVPSLRHDWGLGSGAAGLLTVAVQLGFVAGALGSALGNLPDVVPAHRLMAGSAVVAAATTALAAVLADGLPSALPLRFLTGVALAGVYPTGLKLVTTWFARGRGLALAVMVGALTLGSALPQLLSGLALRWELVLVGASAAAATAGVVALLGVRPGPLGAPAPPIDVRYAVTVFRERPSRLVSLGYFGHMWELYAMWTWLPAIVAASLAAGRGTLPFALSAGVVAFMSIGVAGFAGCLLAGRWSSRHGAVHTAVVAMVVSAGSCVAAALSFGRSPYLLLLVCLVWGASVIADSAMFSTALSRTVDHRYVGTALTIQTAIGYTITVVSIQMFPVVVGVAGWRVAVLLLAMGPVLGAISMQRLSRADRLR
ncbi:MFS transporter [Blastococcus atacamensis]|uniref:MFS transporter n=1 Tax=Blastococcus atacamensis TaxID=2070508 RepID=UPI0018E47DA2|nr:MFS transporter [Blastococcus atacamensis]